MLKELQQNQDLRPRVSILRQWARATDAELQNLKLVVRLKHSRRVSASVKFQAFARTDSATKLYVDLTFTAREISGTLHFGRLGDLEPLDVEVSVGEEEKFRAEYDSYCLHSPGYSEASESMLLTFQACLLKLEQDFLTNPLSYRQYFTNEGTFDYTNVEEEGEADEEEDVYVPETQIDEDDKTQLEEEYSSPELLPSTRTAPPPPAFSLGPSTQNMDLAWSQDRDPLPVIPYDDNVVIELSDSEDEGRKLSLRSESPVLKTKPSQLQQALKQQFSRPSVFQKLLKAKKKSEKKAPPPRKRLHRGDREAKARRETERFQRLLVPRAPPPIPSFFERDEGPAPTKPRRLIVDEDEDLDVDPDATETDTDNEVDTALPPVPPPPPPPPRRERSHTPPPRNALPPRIPPFDGQEIFPEEDEDDEIEKQSFYEQLQRERGKRLFKIPEKIKDASGDMVLNPDFWYELNDRDDPQYNDLDLEAIEDELEQAANSHVNDETNAFRELDLDDLPALWQQYKDLRAEITRISFLNDAAADFLKKYFQFMRKNKEATQYQGKSLAQYLNDTRLDHLARQNETFDLAHQITEFVAEVSKYHEDGGREMDQHPTESQRVLYENIERLYEWAISLDDGIQVMITEISRPRRRALRDERLEELRAKAANPFAHRDATLEEEWDQLALAYGGVDKVEVPELTYSPTEEAQFQQRMKAKVDDLVHLNKLNRQRAAEAEKTPIRSRPSASSSSAAPPPPAYDDMDTEAQDAHLAALEEMAETQARDRKKERKRAQRENPKELTQEQKDRKNARRRELRALKKKQGEEPSEKKQRSQGLHRLFQRWHL